MKTNAIMLRPMGAFTVEQRTKDGMFNATALLKQWNLHAQNSGDVNTHLNGVLKKKDLDDYFSISPTKEYIKTIIEREKLTGKNDVVKAVRGKNGGTWMHPMLFFDFAMWLNPNFRYDVIKFVYDQMIKFRNDAGDAYRELSSSVGSIVSKEFMPVAMSHIAKGLNYIVFNDHQPNIRNQKGSEDLMMELFHMERKLADLIKEKFLHNYEQVMNYLRVRYQDKYTPKVLK